MLAIRGLVACRSISGRTFGSPRRPGKHLGQRDFVVRNMRALFVVRHHNDFDSIAPVIDGWVRRSACNTALIFFANPAVKWRGDYRTQMLLETGKVAFTDVWQIAGVTGGNPIARIWESDAAGEHLQRKLLQIATEARVTPGFSAKMMQKLDDFDPHIVAFDWYSVPTRRKFLGVFGYQECLAWVRLHGRPLVSLPHGLMLYSLPGSKCRLTTPYDAVFVESDRKKALLECSNAFVTGSARYDPSWVKRVSAVLAGGRRPRSGLAEKIRVVFFATKPKQFFNIGELLAWLRHLATHPDVELVIQPHPRGQHEKVFASLAGMRNVVIDSRSPASRLIAQADIVSTVVSSVVVEAVVRKKELLFPKFLTRVNTQFDEMGACISLQKMDSTYTALDAFRTGKRVPRERYEGFLDRFVYGAGKRNTVSRMCGRMAKLAEGAARDSITRQSFDEGLTRIGVL
jgi:hypothetical protein